MQFTIFNDFVQKPFMEGSRMGENVGNAKLESEKLIQQVFIMYACEILVFNSKICIFTQQQLFCSQIYSR